jgi:hypothetical protein
MLTVAHTLEQVRKELEERKHAAPAEPTTGQFVTVLPPKRRTSKHDLANGFSPTEPAAWPPSSRRWHIAVGALAIAASATMFLLTRETEPAAAAASKQAVAEPVAARTPDTVSAPTPSAVPSPAPAAATAEIIPVVAPATTEPPAIKPAHHTLKSRSSSSRGTPVKPRRNPQPLDPDGTLDPYL